MAIQSPDGSWVRAALAALVLPLAGPAAVLYNGPMLGHTSGFEALLWAQTDAPGQVQFRFWEEGRPETGRLTDPVTTRREEACVAKCRATDLRPGRRYGYEVYVDGVRQAPGFREGYAVAGEIPLVFQTPPLWRFREDGHRVFDFRFATGSCAYINEVPFDRLGGTPYGAEYEIFERIHEQRPDFMVWLGDNVYLREPDWTSRTGLQRRWTVDRHLPHLRALLATVHHYGIWDDHDYGPNNAGWDFWQKKEATEAFLLFHGNPSAGLPELPGIFTCFNWGDVNFYLTDNRTYRDSDSSDPAPFGRWKRHLGKEQVDWLVSALKWNQTQSRSSYPVSFNIICTGSQVLSDNPYPENYRTYRDEWQYLFDRIRHEGIDGVVFLSGDVHMTEMTRDVQVGGGDPTRPGGAGPAGQPHVFYDLTVSPFTSGPHTGPSPNTRRVREFLPGGDGSARVRNFAVLDVSGPAQDRTLTVRILDSQGKLLNQEPGADPGTLTAPSVIRARELKAPPPAAGVPAK